LRIGINTRFLLPHKMEGFGWYTYEIVQRLALTHPEHTFILFFDRPFDQRFVFAENCTPVVLSPPARHPILFIYWFEIALKKALVREKVDVFFSPDGYLSLGAKIPQIAVIHDINFEHFPKDIPFIARKYLTYFFPRFAQKAAKLITVSGYSKTDIVQTYGIPDSKIEVIWNGASNHFQPISSVEKESIQNTYTGGEAFFLFVGALHPRKNIGRLLAAYAQFKQVSKSPIKLVIVGEPLWKNKAFQLQVPPEIKEEIIFTGHLDLAELAKITAAALALTYVSYFEGFGIPLVESMRCGTPILSGNLTSLPEIAGDAAIYCDPFNVDDIAEKLYQLADSELLRQQLSQLGLERSKLFSWDEAAKRVWEEIELGVKRH
jgi:glycosyltransferase involved in cell wall biosynthesis